MPGKLECFNDRMVFLMFFVVKMTMVRGISRVEGEV